MKTDTKRATRKRSLIVKENDMTVRELLELNGFITDVRIEARLESGQLVDELLIGLDFGIKPPFPCMVPIDINHVGSNQKQEARYIHKSINAWDDGKDYYQIRLDRFPKSWLDLEVRSWKQAHVYTKHHPRSGHSTNDHYEGLDITVLYNYGKIARPVNKENLHETKDDNQMTITDWFESESV